VSEPKRYNISSLHPHIIEDKNGFMVYYEDYERLKAEVERLTAFTTRTIIPNEELQAQVERLTKAGDELHAFLINYIVETQISSAYLKKLNDDWNAAKEGQP